MTKVRILLFLLTTVFVIAVSYVVSLTARGYRFDSKTLNFRPRGLFVITSVPDGAQVIINGKLESATNATISLPPESYDIELKKDGYISWKKHIAIKKEEVTKLDVYLFPAAPSLSSLTFTGAANPVLSPDRTKIAYGVPTSDKADEEKVGIWIMEMSDLPIGFSREPRRITDLDPTGVEWQWSPDARQLLVSSPAQSNYYLLDIGSFTVKNALVPLVDGRLNTTLAKWQQDNDKKNQENRKNLPPRLADMLLPNGTQGTTLYFSADGTKVLYTAVVDAAIPEGLIPPLPGSSTQVEARSIKKGSTYVYDLKEDKNFLVYSGALRVEKDLIKEASASATFKTTKPIPVLKPAASTLAWFPTSNHLVLAENNKITIMEYDGTNAQTVYAGPYVFPYAIPFPNTSRLLVLTNLGAGNKVVPNLYAVSLR